MNHATVAALVSVLGAAAQASPPQDTVRTYLLDPVVVTATQVEALRSKVPNAVSVLSKFDLQESGETSILRLISEKVPGVFVTERGVLGYGVSNGAAGGITIRGAGGNPNTEVLVLTDGRPQMMGLMGHPLPDTYVNSGVERVEVIRGPASLLFGTNAMGGVINIIRDPPPTGGVDGAFGACYGTFNTQKYEGALGYGTECAGVSVDANHYFTDGQRAYSSFNENNGALRGWTKVSDTYTLRADANVSGFRTYDPGPISSPAVNNWVDILRGSSGFALENRSEQVQGAFKAFYNWGVHDIFDGFHSTDENIGAQLYQGLRLVSENSTTVGVDVDRYGGTASSGPIAYGRHFVNEEGVYLLSQQDLFNSLNVSAGVRLNNHSLYGTEWVPQFGLAFRADQFTTVKASAGKGFRSPTIRELYLFPAPNPTLKPERMWDYEVSLLHSFLEEKADIELTAFIAQGTSQIRVLGVYPNLQLFNSGTFTHRGLEFAGSLRPAAALELSATYSATDPGNETGANPRHKAYVGARYTMDPVTFTLGAQYIVGLYGEDNHQQRLPDYMVVNARVGVRFSQEISVSIAGENLLDRRYENLYEYPMPGATLLVGLNYGAL